MEERSTVGPRSGMGLKLLRDVGIQGQGGGRVAGEGQPLQADRVVPGSTGQGESLQVAAP